VLLGGHYDGHDIAQGASDNAAGAVVGLEMGRLLAPFAGQLRRTVRVICYGCEEIGLLGSWHDADHYANSDERLRVMINLDGAGRGEGGHEQITATADQALADYFASLAGDLRYDLPARSEISAHSDNFPYFLLGFPSVTLSSRDWTAGMIGRGWGHTEADTVDKVRLRGLQSSAAVVARVAVALADAESLPFERRDDSQVRAVLDEAGRTELLTKHWGRDNRADRSA
jgi:Zn-dependent M28 family amino/carboxypeptidase